jgi:uncharacterized membrane protein
MRRADRQLTLARVHVVTEHEMEAVGLAEVDTLRRAGLISASQYLNAVYRCRASDFWLRWALRAMLALGVAHLLAGIIFFFAYNWDDLTPFGKFAILQSGIIISVVAAMFANLERLVGQVLLIAGSVLVGGLFAVIGQVYQTGADAFDLFATWAILIVPWVVASRSATHWFVWLVVVYAAFNLYAFQVLMPVGTLSSAELSCLLAVATTAVLAMREFAVRAGAIWLEAGWTRLVLAIAALAMIFVPAIRYPLDFIAFIEYILGAEAQLLAVLVFLVIVAVFAVVYARLLPDFGVVAISAGFFALFLMTVGARLLAETIGFNWDLASRILPSLGLLVLWCAALTAGTLKFLAIVRRHIGTVVGDD